MTSNEGVIQLISLTGVYLQLRILHLVLRLVELRLKQAVGDSQGSVGHQHHGEFKLSHVLAWREKENVRDMTPSKYS